MVLVEIGIVYYVVKIIKNVFHTSDTKDVTIMFNMLIAVKFSSLDDFLPRFLPFIKIITHVFETCRIKIMIMYFIE